MNSKRQLAALVPLVGLLAVLTATAKADGSSLSIKFFACQSAYPGAIVVPADTPLYLPVGWDEGTRGTLINSLPKIVNVFTVTSPAGTLTTTPQWFGAITHNADGTWGASTRVDLGSLRSGESLTIHWNGQYTGPIEEIVPPSDAWDPADNFLPPWDGTGLKFHNHIDPGPFDNGYCTLTAS